MDFIGWVIISTTRSFQIQSKLKLGLSKNIPNSGTSSGCKAWIWGIFFIWRRVRGTLLFARFMPLTDGGVFDLQKVRSQLILLRSREAHFGVGCVYVAYWLVLLGETWPGAPYPISFLSPTTKWTDSDASVIALHSNIAKRDQLLCTTINCYTISYCHHLLPYPTYWCLLCILRVVRYLLFTDFV